MSKYEQLPDLPDDTAEQLRAIEQNIGDIAPEDREILEEVKKRLAKTYVMPDYITPIIDKTAKALDYAGGAVRGAAGMAVGAVKPEEYLNALKLQKPFPSTSEMMARKGIPEGMLLSEVAPFLFEDPANANEDRWWVPNKEGSFDPSVRGTVGTLIDMAADPLTYASMGTTAATKAFGRQAALAAEKDHLGRTMLERAKDAAQTLMQSPVSLVSKPIGNAAEYIGGKIYKSTVRPLDAASVEFGNLPISQQLLEDNVFGGAGTIYDHIANKVRELTKQRQGITQKLDQLDPVRLEPTGRIIDVEAPLRQSETLKSKPADIVFGGPPAVIGNNGRQLQTGVIQLPQDLAKEEYARIARLYPGYELKGGVPMNSSMDYAIDEINYALRDVPAYKTVEDQMRQKSTEHIALDRVPYYKAGQIKSSLYRPIGDDYAKAAFSEPGTRVRKGMARGVKEAQEGAATLIDPNLSQQLSEVNGKLGDWLTVQPQSGIMAHRPPEGISAPQMVMATAGPSLSPITRSRAILDTLGITPVANTAGFALNKIGKTPLSAPVDAYARRLFVDSRRSPWTLMPTDEETKQ